jgi:transposase
MRISIGIDVAKDIHWVVALNEHGETLVSCRVENDPEAIEALTSDLQALEGERTIGVDLVGGVATVLCAMLISAGEELVYVPGIAVNRARQGVVSGEAKSDPRDARVIADQVRTRQRFRPLALESEVQAAMRLIIARRRDLVTEQTRRVARLHDLLSSFHPGLERRLDLTTKAGLWLLTRYATPSEIRCSDENAIANHLRDAGVRRPEILAAIASEAAHAQKIDPPGTTVAAALCRQLAGEALLVRQQLVQIDQQLAAWLAQHPDGSLICSLPGMGVVLACEFIAKVGNPRRFESADALAANAGLAPVLRQSGKTRYLRRPLGGNKSLKRVFYQSAFCALRDPTNRAFYDRKRREGKRHHQALIALARRRVNVLWAILRDRRPFMPDAVSVSPTSRSCPS